MRRNLDSGIVFGEMQGQVCSDITGNVIRVTVALLNGEIRLV